jgi:3'-phosphoadenosine 5'-phosphosulfate sulfotransferase (PAPS reductase)/FAD synthetase
LTRVIDRLFGQRPPVPGVDFPVPFNPDGSIAWPEADPESPFFIHETPALISFSGGRTSAMMLFLILWAHGGKLPANVYVCFANTGKEREETLRFVHEVGSRFGVHIYWLEWKTRPLGKEGRGTKAEQRFEQVGFNSASRNGEPFRALIRRKGMLPNGSKSGRFCTSDLKIDTMKQFMLSRGFKSWHNAIGLRADEVRRITKQAKRNSENRERFTTTWPLLKGGITVRDVWKFWLAGNVDPKALTEPLPLSFDLGLYPYEGNCDGCFLKGEEILGYQERERPGYLDWWIETEAIGATIVAELGRKPHMGRFILDLPYQTIRKNVDNQPLLLSIDWRSLEFDAECGVSGTDTRIRCGSRNE